MKSFREFLSEAADKEIFFTFGRFNPPTIGHEKLLNKLAQISKGKTHRVYASHSQDSKKNPLNHEDKIKFMRKMFPKHGRAIVDDNANSPFQICSKLYDQGFTQVTMVVGSDRVKEMETRLNAYNGKKTREGFYNFKDGVKVVSAGERDPDADDVSGMSASKMRAAATANDFELFSKGLPSGFKDARTLFNAVRSGMGLKESHNFRKHIQLETVSERREAYVSGDIFNLNDHVVIKETEEIAKVIQRGSNYLVLETSDGKTLRKWLESVEILEETNTQEQPIVEEKIAEKVIEENKVVPLSEFRSKKQQ